MDYIALATAQRADGSWPDVGMNDRRLIGSYRRTPTIRAKVLELQRREWQGRKVRVDVWTGDRIPHDRKPYTVYYISESGGAFYPERDA